MSDEKEAEGSGQCSDLVISAEGDGDDDGGGVKLDL